MTVRCVDTLECGLVRSKPASELDSDPISMNRSLAKIEAVSPTLAAVATITPARRGMRGLRTCAKVAVLYYAAASASGPPPLHYCLVNVAGWSIY